MSCSLRARRDRVLRAHESRSSPVLRGFCVACIGLHDGVALRLRNFAVPGIATALAVSLEHRCFPVYVSWKLLISLGGRPKQWVRTARDTGGNARRAATSPEMAHDRRTVDRVNRAPGDDGDYEFLDRIC